MTQEQKRIKIAEACGWRLFKNYIDGDPKRAQWIAPDVTIQHSYDLSLLPDYFNDLNAMHKAEKTLTAEERRQFAMMLNTIHPTADIFYPDATTRSWESDLCAEVFELVSTTAAKRANAFGRVKGLWE